MRCKRTWTLILVVGVTMVTLGLSQKQGLAIDVLIMNPSFETPVLDPNNFTAASCAPSDSICVETATPVDGWQTVGIAGTWRPTATSYPSGVPDGPNVAYANSSSMAMISQVLDAVLEANASYILGVDIGRRSDDNFPGYKVQLWAGGVLLAEDNNSLLPPPGSFLRSTIVANIANNHPALGEHLEIVLVSEGRQTNFDDVVLTFKPFAPAVKVPFYVKLSTGESELVAKNGTLELRARCEFLNPATRIELFFTSTQDGWFSADGPLAAGAEELVSSQVSDMASYGNNVNGRTAAAPDGSFIGVDRESTGVGVNVLGQDCVSIGAALLVNDPN